MGLTHFPNGLTSFGSVVSPNGPPMSGREFYVRKTTDANYDYWKNSMKHRMWGEDAIQTTIVGAIAAADDFDTIWIYPGEWKETETVAITQDYLKVLAVETGVHGRCFNQTAIYQYDNVDTPCMSIEGANGVEVAGLWFVEYDPGTSNAPGINVAQTASCRGAYIHHNYFYGVASGATGPCHIRLGVDASYDCDSAYIYKNDFYLGGASDDSVGQIEWNSATRAQIVQNNFWTHGNVGTAYAINIYDAAAPRGGIFDNRFMNIEVGLEGSSAVAINNPDCTGGDVQIDRNQFINYGGDANCIAYMLNSTLGTNWNNEAVIASDGA